MRAGKWKRDAMAELLALAMALTGSVMGADEIRYEGVFRLRENGDIGVTTTLTMPMAQYDKMRQNVSSLYLLMRGVAGHRANVEVADKKAEWDDANRKITFTMTWLGAAQHTKDGWAVSVPDGTTFSNLDEAKKTLFFYATAEAPLGKVNGQERLVLPVDAQGIHWDTSKPTVTYRLPEGRVLADTSLSQLWSGAIGLVVAGIALIALSFRPSPRVHETIPGTEVA